MKGTRIALPIALLAAAAGLRADLLDSPMVRLGPELDLFLTAKARVEYDDNLFLREDTEPGGATEGTFYDLTPGLELQYGKDLPLSGSFGIERRHRTFFNRYLANLDDEQDSYDFAAVYEGGGPLRVEMAATYAETARNTDFDSILADPATLVRQTNYLQSIKAVYQFTEKTNAGVGVRHLSNRYDPVAVVRNAVPGLSTDGLTEYDSWAVPLDIRYKYSEKLSVGLALEVGESDLFLARPVGTYYDTLERKFGGLTFNWMATDKLDCELRLGLLNSSYKSSARDYSDNSPSYSIRLSHSVTEKLNQGLIIAQDASAAPNGGISDSFQVGYDLNYNNSEAFRTFLRATYSESDVTSVAFPIDPITSLPTRTVRRTDIRSANVSVGASYAPDTHWLFTFNYSYAVNIEPKDYDVNRVSLEAAFRW